MRVKSKATREEIYRPLPPEKLYVDEPTFEQKLADRQATYFTPLNMAPTENVVDAQSVPGRDFTHAKHVNIAAVYEELKKYLQENADLKRIICCYSEGSRERLQNLMREYGISETVTANSWAEALKLSAHHIVLVLAELEHGFKNSRYCLISEQDVLGERQHRKTRKVTAKNFIADVSALSVGELVVHIEHGIGRFLGLENIVAGGAPHDCIKLLYAHDDKLFVPVENIDVISRYVFDDSTIYTLDGYS